MKIEIKAIGSQFLVFSPADAQTLRTLRIVGELIGTGKNSKILPLLLSSHQKDYAFLTSPTTQPPTPPPPTNTKTKIFAYLYETFTTRFITSGSKYGGDFLLYEKDPLIVHSEFIVRIIESVDFRIGLREIVVLARVARNVAKKLVLCCWEGDTCVLLDFDINLFIRKLTTLTPPPSSLLDSLRNLVPIAIRDEARNEAWSHIISINADKNNTYCHLGNHLGHTLVVTSAGNCGLKKSMRGTSDAGFQSSALMVERAKEKGIVPEGVHVRLKGFGPGRDQAFRAVFASGWNIIRITDISPIRFGGCRPKKKRRI